MFASAAPSQSGNAHMAFGAKWKNALEITLMCVLGVACSIAIVLPYTAGVDSPVTQVGSVLLLTAALFALTYMLARRTSAEGRTQTAARAATQQRCAITICDSNGQIVHASAKVIRHADGGMTIFDVVQEEGV